MEQTTMFDNKAEQPLASRLRPDRWEEFVGQKHLIGEGKVLRRLIESDHISSMIFWGPPGVGKTTVGMEIADRMGREFYDIDQMIVYDDGREIPQIFAEEGEEYFRQLEQKIVLSLANVTGAVIACGGGVVTREENYYALAENGRLIFLNRDLTMLPTDGRPIRQAVPLARLYRMRLPLYRSWCDAELTITGMQPDEAARHIIDML